MALVRLWNDNIHEGIKYPFEQEFKGDKIYIQAGEFIEMDENEAVEFRGKFKAPVLGVDGEHLPAGFKRLRIEHITNQGAAAKLDDMQCLACNYKASSKADLDEHTKTHSAQVLVDEVAEAELKARRGKAKAS